MPDKNALLEQIRALVEEDFDRTNAFILEQLSTKIPFIKLLGEHILQSGGKRLRPLLVLLTAKLFDYTGDAQVVMAAVVEFIHTATLLHDDVVDKSTLRRGKKTANALWGNDASILVGDFLYSRTFQLIVKTGSLEAMTVLATATNQLAEGEVMQLLNVNKAALTQADYYEIIHCKTAMLFSAAAQMGPILAQRSAIERDALKDYGKYLGLAFQIIDDLLDYDSNAKEMGKNPGDDLTAGKMTLPLIYALEKGNKAQQSIITSAIEQPSVAHLDNIMTVIEETKALAYTRACAIEQANKATAALDPLPDNAYRQGLMDLAHFSVVRGV